MLTVVYIVVYCSLMMQVLFSSDIISLETPVTISIRFSLLYSMDSSSSNVQVVLCATLEGHKDSVTAITAPSDPNAKFIVSGSRGTHSPHFLAMDGRVPSG
jgi:hypothetical protein